MNKLDLLLEHTQSVQFFQLHNEVGPAKFRLFVAFRKDEPTTCFEGTRQEVVGRAFKVLLAGLPAGKVRVNGHTPDIMIPGLEDKILWYQDGDISWRIVDQDGEAVVQVLDENGYWTTPRSPAAARRTISDALREAFA